jgi:hypothetical protein
MFHEPKERRLNIVFYIYFIYDFLFDIREKKILHTMQVLRFYSIGIQYS